MSDLTKSVEMMLRQARAIGSGHADLINMPIATHNEIMGGVARYNRTSADPDGMMGQQDVMNAMNVGLAVGYRWATRDLSTFDGVIIVTLDGVADRVPTIDDLRASIMRPQSAADLNDLLRPKGPATLSDILRWIMGGAR